MSRGLRGTAPSIAAMGLALLLPLGAAADEVDAPDDAEPQREVSAAPAVPAGPAAAAAPSADPRPLPEGPTDPPLVLSLDEAVELALVDNMDLATAGLDRDVAAARIDGTRGAWDPVLDVFTQHGRNVSPQATTLDAPVSVNVTDTLNTSITQALPYGARYTVQLNGTRTETNNPFFSLSPSYSTDVLVKFTQPLLRGLGRDANRRALAQALNAATIASHQLAVRARNVVKETIDAYWELVFAREDLEVREAALSLAERLLRQNRIMVDVGTLAPLEISQAEAAVATRRQDIIVGRAAIGAAEDALRRLIGLPSGAAGWRRPIVPADALAYRDAWVDLDEALTVAFERRVELESAELQVENARLDLAFARDQVKPRLDFELSLSSAGLAGVEHALIDTDGDTVPETSVVLSDTGVGTALEDVFNREFNSWSASLHYNQPLFNRAARAEHAVARLGVENRLVDLEKTRQAVTLEVRQAARNIQSARERIQATQAARVLQERKLDAEIKKFENGLSTNFEVLQFQTDLTAARSAELRALVDYLEALAELEQAQGTLLGQDDFALAEQ